jgi:hypothetical protein
MRKLVVQLLLTATAVTLAACDQRSSHPATPAPPATPASQATPSAGAATFVNRVWRVERSSAVAPGTLYAFLADGTLVITSAGNKPLVGSWSRSGAGLVMVEESISYPVDILELTGRSFVIRSHNPGEPVDVAFVPADAP